ncbi:MAG: YbjN domain-containing protein [Candidatus Obscuribacterales bacterium]|nr:YbjN domain-containing protein [Candidatus Obscuribacterales bacterium]
MSLFGAHKVTGTSLDEVAGLIQNYFKGRGLDPHKQEIPGAEGCGWWLTEGSAKVYVFVQDSPAGPVLRITSPILNIPQNNQEAFSRRLLELNSNLASCHLATYENYVLVLTQRQTLGIVQEEVDSMVWNVAYVADLLDDKLAAEFGTTLYKA